MAESHKFKIGIPKTHKIAYHEFEVAGIFAHLTELEKALAASSARFEMVREPSNRYDSNAIAIQVARQGLFGIKYHHIGYVPKDIAAEIAQNGDFDSLMFRPKTMWRGDAIVKMYGDLLAPK